jgi:acetyl esterase/lipase
MTDDRCITESCNEITDARVWNKAQTQFGWACYLGENPGDVSPYAAPARARDLSGLPPAYSCVGELDPFRDETIAYVSRLAQAGVPVEFHLYPGCFHGFQGLVPDAEISKRSLREQFDALKRALHG